MLIFFMVFGLVTLEDIYELDAMSLPGKWMSSDKYKIFIIVSWLLANSFTGTLSIENISKHLLSYQLMLLYLEALGAYQLQL